MSDDDKSIPALSARLKRAEEDVQTLYAIAKETEKSLNSNTNEIGVMKSNMHHFSEQLKPIIDDKDWLFKGMMTIVATLVISGSLLALGIKAFL